MRVLISVIFTTVVIYNAAQLTAGHHVKGHAESQEGLAEKYAADLPTTTDSAPTTIEQEILEPRIVETKSGKVRGQVEMSRSGGKYYSFKGVPYAEKPGRFEVAQPVKPWRNIKEASSYGSICPQSDLFQRTDEVQGDEDCLYLNIFTPHEERCQDKKGKLPVLFHIHGGGFVVGSGEMYGPNYLMDECIVYVSINYRLGVFGFLTTQDNQIPGNLGLKDSLLALKWTHDNIEHFGGDKDAVTLTGISAGGIIVSHFIASPAAKGLFSRVIAQSGSSLTASLTELNPLEKAMRLGKFVNCTTNSTKELKECLKTKSSGDIVKAQALIRDWLIDFVRFAPVIEPQDAVEPFQTVDPYLRIKRGEGSRVPLITGVIQDEGIMLNAYPTLFNPAALEDLNKNWYKVAPILFFSNHRNFTEEQKNRISDQIKDFYFGDKPIGQETSKGLVDLEGDRNFIYASWEEAKLHSKYAPTYHYTVTFAGNYSLASTLFKLPNIVVSHAHDAQFLYPGVAGAPDPEPNSDRLTFSNNLIKLWVSFMNSGTPTDVYPNVTQWKPFTAEQPSTLLLDLPAQNVPDFRKDRMDLWESLKLRELQFPQEISS